MRGAEEGQNFLTLSFLHLNIDLPQIKENYVEQFKQFNLFYNGKSTSRGFVMAETTCQMLPSMT